MVTTSQIASRFKTELSAQIVASIAGALLTVLLARLLNPSEYGLLYLAIAVFSIFKIVSRLGIGQSTARYITEYKQVDPLQIPHILRTSVVFISTTSLLTAAVLVLTHRQLAIVLDEPELTSFFLLGALFLATGTLTAYARRVLQGFEAIEFAAATRIIERVGRLVIAVGLVIAGFGALGALGGFVVSYLLAGIFGFYVIYTRYYDVDVSGSPMQEGLRRRIFEYSIPLTATNTADVLDKQVDTVLVGLFLNPAAVSFYTIGKQAMRFIEKPVTALGFTLSPTFGTQKAGNDLNRAGRLYETALLNSLLLYVPAGAGLALVAEPVIKATFGTVYLGAVPVLQVFALYAILRSMTKLTSDGLDYLGLARERAIVKGCTSILNVVLNVLFIPLIGVVGAAIATVITYAMYTFANLYLIHTQFDLQQERIQSWLSGIAIITVSMSLVVYAVLSITTGIVSVIAAVSTGVALWTGLSIQTGLLDVKSISSYI